MERSNSLPPIDTFNPFWSQKVRDERLLEKLRPADLPRVPQDEWDLEPNPIQDGRARGKGSGGNPGEEKARKRSRSGDGMVIRRGRVETRLDTTIDDFETPPSGWMFGKQRQQLGGEGHDSRGFSSGEPEGMPDSGLERELEKSVCRLLHEENLKLRMELEMMKEAARTESSWSEVPSRASHGWIPPPPPMDECPQTPKTKKNKEERWTPMGTKVPPEPVERWLPPVPPMPVTSVDLRDYEWLDERRFQHHGENGGKGGSRSGHKGLEETGRNVELETEVEALQALLKNQASGGWSEYWSMTSGHQPQSGVGICRDDRAWQHRDGSLPDRRAWLHGDEVCHDHRAWQQGVGLYPDHRAWQHREGVCLDDRALQLQPGLCQDDRAEHHQHGAFRGDRAHQHGGVSHHGVRGLHQQLDCGVGSAPRGEDKEEETGSGQTDPEEKKKLEKEIARLKRELEANGVDLERAKKTANTTKEEDHAHGSLVNGAAPNDGNLGTGRTLPELKGDINPITLGDWLVLISPVMKDLTPNSSEWWDHTKAAAEHFYTKWRGSSPLDRVQIQPELPAKLRQQPFLRTEQRGVSLLLQAIPEDIRQLLVASRELCSTTILYRLLVTFQPGGPNEKALLLRKLTEVAIGKDLAELSTSIRGWRRHFQRALEIQTTLPDPTLLVHALDGPSGVVAKMDSQAAFRLAQSRSTLAVDESPTQESVWLFSQCVLAEVESLQLQSGASTAVSSGVSSGPKVKQLEVRSPPRLTKDGQQKPCHFWGSNDGCKMGARCGFLHDWSKISDRQGRCWSCSATTHMKPDCPARQEASQSRNATGGSDGGEKDGGKDGGGKKGGKGKKGVGKNKGPPSSSSTTANGSTSEAGVEKTTSTTPPEAGQSGGKPALASMEPSSQQAQPNQQPAGESALVQEVTSLLRSLRTETTSSASIKVCSVRRISSTEEQVVLIDGGATHCLREVKSDEEWKKAKEIRVALAEGDTMMKQVERTKTLITQERVQPIVPMCLVTALGYKVEWTAGECRIHHGTRGQLPVKLCQGCPTLPLEEGMRLMEEVEQLQSGRAAIRAMLTGESNIDPRQQSKLEGFKSWFEQVPMDLLEKIPGNPQWRPESLPWNRRRRRQCERAKRLIIYMCSGPEESEWLRWQDKDTAILCLDVLLGCDLLNDDVAGWMEHLVTSRSVSLWLSSPPCRTVSVCRNDEDGGPPVIRGDGARDRFGLPNLTAHQQRQAEQDSVLWLRNLYWMSLAYETSGGTMEALIEQPRDPNEWKEPKLGYQYPSFLRWPETKTIQEKLKLRTVWLEQGALGHATVKPTTLLSSIPEVWQLHEMKKSTKAKKDADEGWPGDVGERIQKSKSLSAWAPGLKSLLGKVIGRIKSERAPTVARMTTAEMEELRSWEAHVRRGHCPYRKDCAVCVEARGRDKQRRRQVCPDSFTMSIDISGPYEPGFDQHVNRPRYYITSVVTIPKVGENPLVEGLRDLGVQVPEIAKHQDPEAPQIAMVNIDDSNEQRGEQLQPQAGGGAPNSWCGGSSPAALPQPPEEVDVFPKEEQERKVELSVVEVKEAEALDRQWAECIQGRPRVEVENLSQSLPLRSRTVKDVIHAVALMYTRFKSLNIPINRIHTDRAKEFLSKEFRQWVLARDVRQSTTAGDEAATNGRVESELGVIRGEARSLLKSSGLAMSYWPMAVRAASEARFRSQLRAMGVPTVTPLPFGIKAYAHQKRWHRTSDWESPKQLVTLLGPAADMTMSSGGYYAELANGKFILTTAVIVPASSRTSRNLVESVADLPNLIQEVHRGESGEVQGEDDQQQREARAELDIFDDEAPGDFQPQGLLEEIVTELVVDPMQSSGVGEPQRFPKTHGLTHRLHGKQTVIPKSAAIPTIAYLALRARGEDEVDAEEEEFFRELGDQWQQDVGWMLFQHKALSQVCQELVLDIQEGIESVLTSGVLEKVQGEVRILEGRLKAIQGVEQEKEAENQVLQTKTVSMMEVKEKYKEWIEPFDEEYQTLIKTVIKPLSASQAREEIGTAEKVQRVPGKLVATIKPPSKKRGRIVACGNYAEQATSETSASGLDTICIRAMVRIAADRKWSLTSTDVRKAFLNAPRVEKEGHLTLVDPPKLLQTMGITQPGEVWKIQGALYGFQESPYHWSIHRDKTLLGLSWGKQQRFWLEETKEKNLWKIRCRSPDGSSGQLAGFVGIYVDDVLVAAPTEVASEFMQCLGSTWECAEPEWLTPMSKNKMRFCGYEIGVLPQGGFSLSQPSYVKDLLRKHEIQNEFEKVAAPKIVAAEDEEFDQFTLHQAQMITGVQWVQSRTRPDLAFIVNAMSRWTHRRPKYVWEIGCHVLRFLNFSQDWELWYEPSKSNDWGKDGVLQKPRSMSQLEVYIDTSFGLEHEQSRSVHGMLHEWAGAPLQWHSGRQPWIAASTGEAELIGYAEAHQQALSIGSVIELFHEEPSYVLYGDCKAALALATAENGPWRTRHLRMRAHRLRESLRPPTSDPHAEPRWSARHLDGKKLVSDGLTKPLQGSLFQQFALRLGLHGKGLDIPVSGTPAIKKINQSTRSEEGEVDKTKMMMILGGLLLKSGGPMWIGCGLALILYGIKRLKERNREKDKFENAPCLRAFRPFGSDQHPVRPTRDPQQSTAGQSGQAVVGGYTNSGVSTSPTTSEVPGWWELPEVQRPLGGKDRWMILNEKWLVRVHGESRRRCFQPVHRSCPVDISKIGATRYSLVHPANDRFNRRLREDDWMKPTTWTMDYLWVGFTIFEIEKEEAPTTQPSQAASSMGPRDPTTEGQARTGDGDELSSRNLAYAPVMQNTSHGPIVNVTVNLHGISTPVDAHHSTMTSADTAESDLEDYELVQP